MSPAKTEAVSCWKLCHDRLGADHHGAHAYWHGGDARQRVFSFRQALPNVSLRQHVARGGICYEPFTGHGSQIIAGEANGRRIFGMEISPAYVDVVVDRWQAETGREATLGGDGRTFAELKADRLGV